MDREDFGGTFFSGMSAYIKLTQLTIWIPFRLWTWSRKLLELSQHTAIYLVFYSSLEYCEQHSQVLNCIHSNGTIHLKKEEKNFPQVSFSVNCLFLAKSAFSPIKFNYIVPLVWHNNYQVSKNTTKTTLQ